MHEAASSGPAQPVNTSLEKRGSFLHILSESETALGNFLIPPPWLLMIIIMSMKCPKEGNRLKDYPHRMLIAQYFLCVLLHHKGANVAFADKGTPCSFSTLKQ